jgi:hypothetical protein
MLRVNRSDTMKILPQNEHVIERIARVAVGVGLLLLVFFGPKTAWGWLGLIPLVTGAVGSCPIYTLFGISTCPRRDELSRAP